MTNYLIEHKGDFRDIFENAIKCDLKPLTKEPKPTYLPNLSNCCKSALKQHKFCGKCGSEVVSDKELIYKGFKIDKELKPIPISEYEKILEHFDGKRIVIEKFVDLREIQELNENFLYITEKVFEVKQDEKEDKQALYEYWKILSEGELMAYGKMNLRSMPYQVVILPFGKSLILRLLSEKRNIYDLAELKEEIINLDILKEKIDITKVLKSDTLNLEEFENEREKELETLIKDVLSGKVIVNAESDVKIVKEIKESDVERVNKLKALKEKLARRSSEMTKGKKEIVCEVK